VAKSCGLGEPVDILKAIKTAREWDRSHKIEKEEAICDCPYCQQVRKTADNNPLYIFRTKCIIRTEKDRYILISKIKEERQWCETAVMTQETYELETPGSICPCYGQIMYTQQDIQDLANLLEVVESAEIGKEFY
jgi:hypothetical protein